MEVMWFILGAILGGISLFIAGVLDRYIQKPVLSFDLASIRMVNADLNNPAALLTPLQIPFYSCQIIVKNIGKTAAQNCSGYLDVGRNRVHVKWFTTQGGKTINRDDFEYLEVCGFQEADGDSVLGRLRIAPTENGWADSGKNRKLNNDRLQANVVVTASNAKNISLPITILPVDDKTDPNKPLFEVRGSVMTENHAEPPTTANVPAWKKSLWAVFWLAIIIISITFLSAVITGFTWTSVGKLFEHLWLAYIGILAFVYLLLFTFFSTTYKMLVYSFIGLALVLVIASEKGNWIADKIRGYIDTNFDLNYLIGGIAMFGIVLALIPIWQEIKKRMN